MKIQEKILGLFREGNDLPALPVTVQRIIDVASDSHSSTEDLEAAITCDPAITSKLLKLSNSIYYAQISKVDSIKRAIGVIGYDEIIGVALGMELFSAFDNVGENAFHMASLWMHSIGVATAAKDLAGRISPDIENRIFIPALLHDIGKVFLAVYFKSEYAGLQQMTFEKKIPLHSAENAVLKLNHALISSLLMKRWKFPESIELPCRFHHSPASAPPECQMDAFILHTADYAAHKAGIGAGGAARPKLNEAALATTGLNEMKLDLIVDHLRRKEPEVQAFFDITSRPRS